MQLQFADVARCILKAKEISDLYAAELSGNVTFPKSIEVLKDVCKAYLDRDIVIKDLWAGAGVAHETIRSYCVDFEGAPFEIYLKAGLNNCWRRYCACYEMFHAILEQPESRTTDVYAHVENVVNTFPDASASGNPATIVEAVADFAAMEFLFPYSERQKLSLPLGDSLVVAEAYKVPQVLVERFTGNAFMKALKLMHA